MVRYIKNKVIDITAQNRQARGYISYINNILTYITSPDDIFSISVAKKVLYSTSFIHKSLTAYMSESNAIRMVQLVMNLAVVAWQWIFAPTSTWFAYYVTSPSGLRKVYQCIFTNPVYGILFYSTFYLKLLGGTSDEVKFNQVSKALGLPKHADLGVDNTLDKITEYVTRWIIGDKFPFIKTSLVNTTLKKVAVAAVGFGSQKSLDYIMISALKKSNKEVSSISHPAVYINDRDSFDFDDTDIQKQIMFIKKEHINIKKYIKKNTNPKNKKQKNKLFMEIAQVKAPDGHVICLNKCEQRIKTQMGCYCEGDCGQTTFLGGKKWCWVDPEKCKNGKYLNKFRGYAYDKCENKKLSNTKKCFTGKRYTDCNTL